VLPDGAPLLFRLLAETGCRVSEGLGLTRECVGEGLALIKHQLARDGSLAPLKTARSRRQIEITGGLAAELRLAGGERIFDMTFRGTDSRSSSSDCKAASR